jgi:mono/diheme cytochrome c family protein
VRRLAVLIAALLLPAFVIACGSAEEKGTGPEAVEGGAPQETQTQGETEGETQGETGGEEQAQGDPAAGKEIFASQGCGGCHTFEAAGTSGTTGPNLDDAKPSFDDAREQIAKGGGGMPAYEGQLDEKQIADVAAFVSGSGGG